MNVNPFSYLIVKLKGKVDKTDVQMQNLITATAVASGATENVDLLSGFDLSQYNAISIIIYDSNWIRGDALVTRNPLNGKFSSQIVINYGGPAYSFSVKQSSNTQFAMTNNANIALTVLVKGAKAF